MDSCLFCRIAAGSIPAKLVHQDDRAIAFEDIHPQAPHHVLIVPREHVERVSDLSAEDAPLFGHLVTVAKTIASARGVSDYRLVVNCGPAAGQTVFHLHLHLLGGRTFGWPPG